MLRICAFVTSKAVGEECVRECPVGVRSLSICMCWECEYLEVVMVWLEDVY